MKSPVFIPGSKFIICSLILLFRLSANAQEMVNNDVYNIADKISFYAIKNQEPLLFVHLDKTVYSTNENMWFTAYLLKAANYNQYKTLSVALVRNDNHKVMKEDKFVMGNGIAYGNIRIPDTLNTGDYSFIAYTNRLLNGKPEVLFTQPVTIRDDRQPSFAASLNPLDTSITKTQQKIMLLVNFIDLKKPPATLPVSYYLGNSASPVLKGDVKTTNGQYNFTIPSKLLSLGNNRLHVQVKYQKEIKEITIDLPAVIKPAVVRFFPEGGNMVTGVKSVVGWEVKSFAGAALRVQAMLYQGEKIIDTIETNSYGLGRFTLLPAERNNYYVKLYGVNEKDTLYKLPGALENAPVITVQNAVADNTLLVDVHGDQHKKLYFVLHNYKRLFSETPVDMPVPDRRVRINLDSIPKGLNQLTITDSLGRPFAERTFFAHYNKRVALQINTDRETYASRQKVNLKIKLNPGNAMPDSGVVSIACVQENRIEIKKKSDIESYFYLKYDLDELPIKENYLGTAEADKQHLENILLIKGWRRYTWLDVLKSNPTDTAKNFNNIVFEGTATRYGRKLKKPVDIINLRYAMTPLTTDSAGAFMVNDDQMIVAQDKTMSFLVKDDPDRMYQIKLTDPYKSYNHTFAKDVVFNDLSVPQQQTTQLLPLNGMQRAIQLREVKIAANTDRSFNYNYGAINECGDYVCMYNVFNCRNHTFGGTQPVIGRSYIGLSGPYKGCAGMEKKALAVSGVYIAEEYYPADYGKINPSQPEYVSTIYWKYLAKVTSTNEAEFSFYTSDITGKFKIVIQGITEDDTIYGEKTISVVK